MRRGNSPYLMHETACLVRLLAARSGFGPVPPSLPYGGRACEAWYGNVIFHRIGRLKVPA